MEVMVADSTVQGAHAVNGAYDIIRSVGNSGQGLGYSSEIRLLLADFPG
jgi:hypothetical protein